MLVSVSDAVRDASSDWLLTAGAQRLGNQRQSWPLLTKSSKVINGAGKTYAESYFDQVSPGAFVVEHLADYVELSSWGHVLDGWRYLSLAATSTLQASRNKALHLAYYAELRAAMGILASSGIAVLNRKHFSITATGELRWFCGSTHTIAWEALTAWASSPSNAMIVIEALGINVFAGISWLDACRATSTPEVIAAHWLKNWSFDLTQVIDDRDARNEASYRPELSGFTFAPFISKDLDLINYANRAALHSELNGFTPVQLALIADLCRASADFRFGSSEAREAKFWRETLRWLTTVHQLPHDDACNLTEYIRKSSENDAGKILRLTDTARRDSHAVFARAFYLLQLASFIQLKHRDGINQRASGGKVNWPEAVIQQFGLQSHLWSKNNIPSDLSTIESDAEAASEQISEWKQKNPWSGFNLWKDEAVAMNDICRFERHFVAMASL